MSVALTQSALDDLMPIGCMTDGPAPNWCDISEYSRNERLVSSDAYSNARRASEKPFMTVIPGGRITMQKELDVSLDIDTPALEPMQRGLSGAFAAT